MTTRTGKSPKAFRTISEVAEELGVPQHVLRFWESKFAQIKPVKRGGGRRYYRPEDVELLRAIQTLLYEDKFTIKGVQKLLREHGVKFVMSGRVVEESVLPDLGIAPAEAHEDARQPDLDFDAPQQAPAAPRTTGREHAARRRRLLAIRDELKEIRGLLADVGASRI